MKKNKMMRLASFLLVAVLITTSAISGTYAKYVTSDSGEDSARVAKWGVNVAVDGSLFSDAYKDSPVTYTANETGDAITVQAATADDNVVAPGTKNETGMTFELTGTPEVDTEVSVVITTTDIVLPAGTYTDYTNGDALSTDANVEKPTFTLAADYHPVKFTLKSGNAILVNKGTIGDVETKLESLTKARYDTNTDLSKQIDAECDGKYTLTWEWPFNGNDQADTYLGNVAADTVTDANAKTDISFNIAITVTQLD